MAAFILRVKGSVRCILPSTAIASFHIYFERRYYIRKSKVTYMDTRLNGEVDSLESSVRVAVYSILEVENPTSGKYFRINIYQIP